MASAYFSYLSNSVNEQINICSICQSRHLQRHPRPARTENKSTATNPAIRCPDDRASTTFGATGIPSVARKAFGQSGSNNERVYEASMESKAEQVQASRGENLASR